MKIEAFNKPATKEKVLRLELIQSDSDVILRAVDETGTRISGGNILKIDSQGIYLCSGVSESLGLPLRGSSVVTR